MKLIKSNSNTPAKPKTSALARAKKRLAARQQPEPLPGELFTEACTCGKSGKPFTLTWYRPDEDTLFVVHKVVKGAAHTDEREHQGGSSSEDPSREYPMALFDRSNRTCPWCENTGGFIYCSCGTVSCGGSVYVKDGVRRSAVAGCGCDTELSGNATARRGCAAEPGTPAAPSGHKALPAQSHPQLGHDAAPRLPRL